MFIIFHMRECLAWSNKNMFGVVDRGTFLKMVSEFNDKE